MNYNFIAQKVKDIISYFVRDVKDPQKPSIGAERWRPGNITFLFVEKKYLGFQRIFRQISYRIAAPNNIHEGNKIVRHPLLILSLMDVELVKEGRVCLEIMITQSSSPSWNTLGWMGWHFVQPKIIWQYMAR